MHKRALPLLLVVLVVLGVAAACSDSVSPQDKSLDGGWSTGPLIIGMGMSANLTWTDGHVSGSGGYAVFPDTGVLCGTERITGTSTLVLAATRPSPTRLDGHITFGTGAPFRYQGTLTIDAQHPGFASIEASLTAADGTGCTLPLRQGLIP